MELMVNPKKDSGIMEFKFVTFYLQRKGYLSKKKLFQENIIRQREKLPSIDFVLTLFSSVE